MTERIQNLQQLQEPWLVAAWPGIGNVAASAGSYLIEHLGAEPIGTFEAEYGFDVDSVVVRDGLVQPAQAPRHRLYGWKHPHGGRDLVLYVGEAQPQHGRIGFCERLLAATEAFRIQRVVTFAAIATDSGPRDPSRVLTVGTDPRLLEEVLALGEGLTTLEQGSIGGLNGVFLDVARQAGIDGLCFLGEVPQIAANVPYLKASLAVLELFTSLSGVELDTAELGAQAEAVGQGLEELLARLKRMGGTNLEAPNWSASLGAIQEEIADEDEDEEEDDMTDESESGPVRALDAEDLALIEALFLDAEQDLTHAPALKEALDARGLFAAYEDRFLDLFSAR